MPVTAIVGVQWGDEGKGRIVDWLAQGADLTIRFQGGDNAGHTVINDRGSFGLHLVPSGIFNPQTTCIIGTGCAVNPDRLLAELAGLEDAGVTTRGLVVSSRAHLVMPYHPEIDSLQEARRSGGSRIGTTKRGMGPVYTDKAARCGLRVGDLLHPEYFAERLHAALARNARLFADLGVTAIDPEALLARATAWRAALADRIVDTVPLLQAALERSDRIVLEGQLGVMRDLDWGTYPFVTSSNPSASAAASGAGLPATALSEVIGVTKVYTTAVGAGPFPVELHDADGRRLQEIGREFGVTTGRRRRCGWLDGVALRYACWLNGVTGLAVTKLDVLDTFEEIKICIGYRWRGQLLHHVPDTPTFAEVEPVWETWPGWCTPTSDVRTWDGLPKAARRYLHRISKLAGAPLRLVSVGPEREQLVSLVPPSEFEAPQGGALEPAALESAAGEGGR